MTEQKNTVGGISFIMPAYNEEECIEAAVTEAHKAVKEITDTFEIVIVDDGSADRTPELLAGLSAKFPELRIVRHNKNIGYGAALRSGFTAAKMPLVFYTDSDCQFDPREIPALLPFIGDNDIVAGYRIRRKDNLLRFLVSRSYNLMIRTLFGVRVRDINCAFKMFRREVFDVLKIESDQFFVTAEIFAKARRLGLSVREVGVNHFPRRAGRPTVHPADIPRTLKEILQVRSSVKNCRANKHER